MLEKSFSFFEIAMLLCFAVSWPISIFKTLKTRFVLGKSVTFMIIILIGYVFGIIHKLLYAFDVVVFFYALNFILVGTDIGLYLYYAPKNKRERLKSGT
ncbi:MAG: hypothetical protein PHR19_07775 [Bacteroidales bacterium]|jgi:hypothetical protein|nr:hypothetical protein [Bacteroidales bacterium]HHT52393.1 hypothetical protein [Bacteroidales bacterium]